jgi:hypothetical protein
MRSADALELVADRARAKGLQLRLEKRAGLAGDLRQRSAAHWSAAHQPVVECRQVHRGRQCHAAVSLQGMQLVFG